ncbi:MAG: mandelate racemase/muconate lactonizing enzyme family protein [Alphaproteobacteria bacterium]|nr:mandelate racemase/muconate lactonizing enzyme family protein [Alphaproteobacteria bacterium]
MKITGQKVFVANVARTNLVFVKLYTDSGIDGVGEATLEWQTKVVVAAIEEAERALIGLDPFDVEHIVETLHRNSYWRTGAVLRSALGGIEAALLDIKGKALGVPVYELLGGKHRDRVKCYANHWFFGAEEPQDYAAKARHAVAQGFRALKWDPFEAAYLEMDRAQRHRTIEIVEAVRDAVGPDIDLMLDVHGRLNVPTAIAMSRALERFDLSWMEEPLPPESIDALADVRAKSAIPIAAGERYFEPERFAELIAKRAVDILQPDVGHLGGMFETKKVAGMAHTRFLPVAPHNPTGPVMNAMTLHLAASIPNFSIFETVMIDVPWRRELVSESLEFRDGHLMVPTAPGLGVALNEDACAKFPYEPTDLPIFSGSMNTRGVATGASVIGGRGSGD